MTKRSKHKHYFLKFLSALLITGLPAGSASAHIEKVAILNGCNKDAQICLHWWPVLSKIDGWHQDIGSSYYYNSNALAPDGSTFTNADTVMYAEALYKPQESEKTIDDLIEKDKKTFADNYPSMSILETKSINTADNKKLRSVIFQPKDTGNWERVSYGEEGDYFLVFTLSARNQDGYKKAMPSYEQMVGHYKE